MLSDWSARILEAWCGDAGCGRSTMSQNRVRHMVREIYVAGRSVKFFYSTSAAAETSPDLPDGSVECPPFYMDEREVTVAEFIEFVRESGRDEAQFPFLRRIPRDGDLEAMPMLGVSWHDAADYASWVGKRLPSELEWECAALGSSESRVYPWGDEPPEEKFVSLAITGPRSVMSYPPNDLGFYDLAGGAAEWCGDSFDVPGRILDEGALPKEGESSEFRVVKGGSWFDGTVFAADLFRIRSRGRFPAGERIARTGRMAWGDLCVTGFRCARDAGVGTSG